MSFELRFKDGFQALCRASYSHGNHECLPIGTRGNVEVLAGDKRVSIFGQSDGGRPSPKRLLVLGNEVVREDMLLQQVLLDESVIAIREERPFKCEGAMGLRDIHIIEAFYASAAAGDVLTEVEV